MSAIAVNNNNDKNEVENIIIYFETLPPVMINLIIQFLKLKGEVEYGLTLGGNPSSEVYRLQVGEALQFSLTCKLHHQIFDDSFQYFCFRDFGANINAANVFYPTLIEGDGINERIKFNDGVVTGLPIQLYTDTSDSKKNTCMGSTANLSASKKNNIIQNMCMLRLMKGDNDRIFF